jgi:hypothetical protein
VQKNGNILKVYGVGKKMKIFEKSGVIKKMNIFSQVLGGQKNEHFFTGPGWSKK